MNSSKTKAVSGRPSKMCRSPETAAVAGLDDARRAFPRMSSFDLPPVLDARTGELFPSWKLVDKRSAHPLHSMMARAGSFPPALARYLILGYSDPGDLILDPFCGKGTTLLEAVLCGRKALASDVAPDAVAVTRAKLSSVKLEEVDQYLDSIERALPDRIDVPGDVRVFFHMKTLRSILEIMPALLDDAASKSRGRAHVSTFLIGCMLGILHGHASHSLSLSSSHAYAMAPGYVRKYARAHKLKKPIRHVVQCLKAKSRALLSEGAIPKNSAAVYQCSAERYLFNRRGKLNDQVDLILTSPPYLNAQTYAKDAWLRLWLLGHDYRAIRRALIETGSQDVYVQRMGPCLAEMLNVLKPRHSAFIVAGDVVVTQGQRKRVVRTAELLGDIAVRLKPIRGHGFRIETVIEDPVADHSRYYFSVHGGDGDKPNNMLARQTPGRLDRIVHLSKVPLS